MWNKHKIMTNKITKILLLTVFGYLSMNAAAQRKMDGGTKYPADPSNDVVSNRVQKSLFKKANYCGWFFPTLAIDAITPLTSYVDFLTTDSTSRFVNADGTSRFNTLQVAGVCFDPKDENFLFLSEGVNLSKYNPYKVDSIYFTYQYVRKLDEVMIGGVPTKVVDTLIVQFHNPGNMTFSSFGSNPAEVYGFPKNFSRSIGGATGAAYTEKVPLTENDSTTVTSTGWRSKAMVIAIPASVAQAAAAADKNQVGFNIYFKQMVPNAFGDTTEARNNAPIKNPVNYFGYGLRINENTSSQINQEEYRNNAYFTYARQFYGGSINGWTPYIAGNAYFSARYMYSAFHLCTPNLTASDINKNGYGVGKVVPNPAKVGEDINIEFSIGNPEHVTLTVSDLLSKTLKTIHTEKLNAGHNYITINTANFTPGLYFYTLTAGGFKASKKITIVD